MFFFFVNWQAGRPSAPIPQRGIIFVPEVCVHLCPIRYGLQNIVLKSVIEYDVPYMNDGAAFAVIIVPFPSKCLSSDGFRGVYGATCCLGVPLTRNLSHKMIDLCVRVHLNTKVYTV